MPVSRWETNTMLLVPFVLNSAEPTRRYLVGNKVSEKWYCSGVNADAPFIKHRFFRPRQMFTFRYAACHSLLRHPIFRGVAFH